MCLGIDYSTMHVIYNSQNMENFKCSVVGRTILWCRYYLWVINNNNTTIVIIIIIIIIVVVGSMLVL